jgi:acyl-CoA synthetase (AMP-forming)/AMP-acid ligase II
VDETTYLRELQTRWDAVWPHPSLPREPVKPFGDVPVHRYLERHGEQTPERDFLIFYGRRLSYAEVDRLANRFAAWLQDAGVGKGGHVALVLPNCPQFYIAYFGALKIGAVAVLLNPILKSLELEHLFTESQPEVVVASDQTLGEVMQGLARAGSRPRVLGTAFDEFLPQAPELDVPPSMQGPAPAWPEGAAPLMAELADQPESRPNVDVAMTDVATMNFTGGTTGLPKGVLHRHRNILYTASSIYTYSYNDLVQARHGGERVDVPALLAQLSSKDVVLAAMPIFWIAGKDNGVDGAVVAGTSVVLLGRWDAATALNAIHRYRVTQNYAPFDLYWELLDYPERSRYDLTSLRLCLGSSFIKGLTPELRARWREVTQGAILREGAYGLTETHTMDTMTAGFQQDDEDIERARRNRAAFCGIPMPGTEIKIVDPDSGVLLPLGSEGAVAIRSPSVVDGYLNKPEETAKSFRGGWLHTGDIGKFDADGFFYYVARTKYMLKVSGISVYPPQIEALLLSHPGIEMACVIGAEDAKKGQAPVAYVKLADNSGDAPDEAALMEWCRENMAAYNVPREIIVTDTMPLTATGKVIREDLIARYKEEPAPGG